MKTGKIYPADESGQQGIFMSPENVIFNITKIREKN